MMRILLVFIVFLLGHQVSAQQSTFTMPVGYALNIHSITQEKMDYAKSLGIDYIELSNIGSLLDKDLLLKFDEEYWSSKIDTISEILQKSGVSVWSIHMPFSQQLDLSTLDEEARLRVIQAHVQVLKVLKRLHPQIILFHPSYYLEFNERDARINQLVKSVKELHESIAKDNMIMVVENMLGPTLTVGSRERPLLRTVEECVLVFNRFPVDVGIAVDMCHIAHPELLIREFGSRVKTLHVSDGNGKAETHYLPCTNQGENNWNLILSALEDINYNGVFMYECKYSDEKELVDCYDFLWNNFKQSTSNK